MFFLINANTLFGMHFSINYDVDGVLTNVKYRFNPFIIGRPIWSFNGSDAAEFMDHSGSLRAVGYAMNLINKLTSDELGSDNYLPDPEKVSEEFAEAARKDRTWRIMNILRGENF